MASKILCFARSNHNNTPNPKRYDDIGSHSHGGSSEGAAGAGGSSSCIGSRGGMARTSSSTTYRNSNSSPARSSDETPLLVVDSVAAPPQRRRQRRLFQPPAQQQEQRPPLSPQQQEDLETVNFWRQHQNQQQQQQNSQSQNQQLQQQQQQNAMPPPAVPDTIETSQEPPNLNDLSMDSLEDHVQLDQVAQVWKQKGNIPIETVVSDDSSHAAVRDNDDEPNNNGAFPTFSMAESQVLLLKPPPQVQRHRDRSASSSCNNSLLASSSNNSLLAATSICSKTVTTDTLFTYDDDGDPASPAPLLTPERRQRGSPVDGLMMMRTSESYISSTSSRGSGNDEDEILRQHPPSDPEWLEMIRESTTDGGGKDVTSAENAYYDNNNSKNKSRRSQKYYSQGSVDRSSTPPPAAAAALPPPPSPKSLHPYATAHRPRVARYSPSTPDSDSVYVNSITNEASSVRPEASSPAIGRRPDIDDGDVPPASASTRSGLFTELTLHSSSSQLPANSTTNGSSSSKRRMMMMRPEPEESELLDAIVAAMDEKQQAQQSSSSSSLLGPAFFVNNGGAGGHPIRTSRASAASPLTAVSNIDAAAKLFAETKTKSDNSNNHKDSSTALLAAPWSSTSTTATTTATTPPLDKPSPSRSTSSSSNSWMLSPSARDSSPVQFHAAWQEIPVVHHHHHRRVYSADGGGGGGASERRRERHHRTMEESSGSSHQHRTPKSLLSPRTEPASIEQQLLGSAGGGAAAVFPAKLFEAQQENDFQEAEDEDHLSDVSSSVDADTKNRYLQACRLLKAALIEKKPVTAATSNPLDQSLIESILSEPDFSQGQPIQSRRPSPAKYIQKTSKSMNSNSFPHHIAPQYSDRLSTDGGVVAASVGSSAFMDTFGFDVATGMQDPKGSYSAPPTPTPPSQQHPTDSVVVNNRAAVLLLPPLQIPGSHPLQSIKDAQVHQQQQRQPSLISPMASEEERSRADVSDLSSGLHPEYPFRVLGLEHGQAPSILTPAMMEALRGFFPVAVSEENFWLKYSSERHGDSILTLIDKIRPCKHTILCVKTTDGHVFGAFCSTPWRMQSTWYGSGEAFLWRLKHPRHGFHSSHKHRSQQQDNHDHDHEIEIYPYTGEGGDNMIQYCSEHSLAVGGAHDWYSVQGGGSPYSGEPPGIGLLIDGDLKGGETNSCTTFANPRLGDRSSPLSNEFDIDALEVWTVTPCLNVSDAQELEMHHLFRRQIAEGK